MDYQYVIFRVLTMLVQVILAFYVYKTLLDIALKFRVINSEAKPEKLKDTWTTTISFYRISYFFAALQYYVLILEKPFLVYGFNEDYSLTNFDGYINYTFVVWANNAIVAIIFFIVFLTASFLLVKLISYIRFLYIKKPHQIIKNSNT